MDSTYPSFLLPKQDQVKTKQGQVLTKKKLNITPSKIGIGSVIKSYAKDKLESDLNKLNKKIEKQQYIVDNYNEYLETCKKSLQELKTEKSELEKIVIEF